MDKTLTEGQEMKRLIYTITTKHFGLGEDGFGAMNLAQREYYSTYPEQCLASLLYGRKEAFWFRDSTIAEGFAEILEKYGIDYTKGRENDIKDIGTVKISRL